MYKNVYVDNITNKFQEKFKIFNYYQKLIYTKCKFIVAMFLSDYKFRDQNVEELFIPTKKCFFGGFYQQI